MSGNRRIFKCQSRIPQILHQKIEFIIASIQKSIDKSSSGIYDFFITVRFLISQRFRIASLRNMKNHIFRLRRFCILQILPIMRKQPFLIQMHPVRKTAGMNAHRHIRFDQSLTVLTQRHYFQPGQPKLPVESPQIRRVAIATGIIIRNRKIHCNLHHSS